MFAYLGSLFHIFCSFCLWVCVCGVFVRVFIYFVCYCLNFKPEINCVELLASYLDHLSVRLLRSSLTNAAHCLDWSLFVRYSFCRYTIEINKSFENLVLILIFILRKCAKLTTKKSFFAVCVCWTLLLHHHLLASKWWFCSLPPWYWLVSMGWLMSFLHLKFPFHPGMVAVGLDAIFIIRKSKQCMIFNVTEIECVFYSKSCSSMHRDIQIHFQ